MSKTAVSMTLPKIGERLVRIMTCTTWDANDVYRPEACEVTYVNNAKHWFEVRFLDTGIKECYHLPTFDHSILGDTTRGGIPIMCIETGSVYSNQDQCARDMKLWGGGISKCLSGEASHCGGYHFCTVL